MVKVDDSRSVDPILSLVLLGTGELPDLSGNRGYPRD